MHNYYAGIYNKAVFSLLEKEKGKGQAILFARSATVGTQRFPVHWGGDCSATYPSMAESLRGGLSFALSGFSFWSHDIGGFEMTASPDLYKRWLAFGLLSTHSRLHGSKSYRVPWIFDEEAVAVCKKFTHLKMKLMPYIYGVAVQAHEEGVPVMRPMILEFNKDPAVKYLDMQYMLGDSILVAPIFRNDGKVSYYLPKGSWTHLLSGEVREGGSWQEDSYDYFSLPLYVKEATLLPIGNCIERPDYDYTKELELRLYELKEGEHCERHISDENGNIVLTVQAERKDGVITLTSSELFNDMRYVLINISNVDSVIGATIREDTEYITLLPTDNVVTVKL